MKKYILILLLTISTSIFAQNIEIIVSGKPSNGILKWSDFTGPPDTKSKFYATTYYNSTYNYWYNRLGNGVVQVYRIDIVLYLDPEKSWSKRQFQTAALLKHEQGHFDIGILSVREMKNGILNHTFYESTIAEDIQNYVNQINQKYAEYHKEYDRQTNHFLNVAAQAEWNKYFKETLATYQ